MGNTIRDTDRGAKRLLKALKAKPASILVGVQGKEAVEPHEESPLLTVGDIATFSELGLGQPERSWLRDWVDANKPMIEEDLRKVMRKVILLEMTAEQGIQLLGVKYVGLIQTRIASGIAPPNAESTIARKESSTPLIASGQFRSAITFTLEKLLQGMGT